jgi:hypothetical protein
MGSQWALAAHFGVACVYPAGRLLAIASGTPLIPPEFSKSLQSTPKIMFVQISQLRDCVASAK